MPVLAFLVALVATPVAAAPGVPLRMNDIQVVGSHNSYKRRIAPVVLDAIRKDNAKLADALDYDHPSLTRQLDIGLRQLEIDIFADPQGGRFADPVGEAIAVAAGEPTGFERAAMRRPGFKVFHIPGVDYLSGCVTLKRCLAEIDRWSRAHPRHLPIMVTINAADRPINKPGIPDPLPLAAPLLDALDAEIRTAIAPGRLITPDGVRGKATTLREAVLAHGWPSLDKARGHVFLVFDVPSDVSERYRAGHPSLKGRAMFGLFPEDSAEAATMIVQDPLVDGTRIRRWVEQGFIVRTRTDADTAEARRGDHAKADAAAASGAQAVSTDYYPGAPDRPWGRFEVTLPGGVLARCNPVRQPASCWIGE